MASTINRSLPVENSELLSAEMRAQFNASANDIDALQTSKQAALVSSVNIKTVNGESILGAGDLIVAGGGAVSSVNGYTGVVTLSSSDVGADPTGTAAAAVGALASTLATVATSGAYADLSGKPTLGTAAPLNIPASGDAASGEVVKGNDSRLTNARTPTNLTGPVTSTGSATAIANGAITNAMLANSAVANLSNTNSGDETGARIGTLLHAAANKTTLVDADETTGLDSAASFGLIRTTWTNVKAFLKTYFDTLYAARLLTGYVSGAGTVAAGDTPLQAIQKLNGNDALKAPLASPTFTGTVTLPAGQVVNGVTLTAAGGTTNFLRADGSYAAPGGGSGDFKSDGTVAMTGAIATTVGTMTSSVANGGTAKAFSKNTVALTTAGAKIESWANNGVEKAFIDKDGILTVGGKIEFLNGLSGYGFIVGGGGYVDGLCVQYSSSQIAGFNNSKINLASNVYLSFSSTTSQSGTPDIGTQRIAANVIGVTKSSTSSDFGDLKLRNLIATGYIQTAAVTVGTLPTASGVPYAIYSVTDSLTPVSGATVAAGGSAKATVQSNGTNWIVLGTL